MQEIAEAEIDAQECTEFVDNGGITEMPESDTNSSDEPDVEGDECLHSSKWINCF